MADNIRIANLLIIYQLLDIFSLLIQSNSRPYLFDGSKEDDVVSRKFKFKQKTTKKLLINKKTTAFIRLYILSKIRIGALSKLSFLKGIWSAFLFKSSPKLYI